MNESHNPKRGLHRRDLLKGVAAASLGFATGEFGAPQASTNLPVSRGVYLSPKHNYLMDSEL